MSRPSILTVVKWVFAAVVIVFGAIYIGSNASRLAKVVSDINPGGVVLAFVLTLLALALAFVSWFVLWPAFGVRLPWRRGARVFFVSQTGKYVPGSVWPIAVQAAMAKSVGLKRTSSVILSLISMAVSIAVGLAFGSIVAVSARPELARQYPWVIAVAVLLVICLAPRIVRAAAALASRVMRQGRIQIAYGWPTALRSAGAQLGNWILSGTHLWVILVALGADPARTFFPSLAAFSVGFSLGVLLIPFPAGLGVRETVISLMLAGIVGSPTAVAAALVSRVLFAIADFALAGATMLLDRRSVREERAQRHDVALANPSAEREGQ